MGDEATSANKEVQKVIIGREKPTTGMSLTIFSELPFAKINTCQHVNNSQDATDLR